MELDSMRVLLANMGTSQTSHLPITAVKNPFVTGQDVLHGGKNGRESRRQSGNDSG